MKKVFCISFSDNGYQLASRIAASFGTDAVLARGGISHKDWTKEHWSIADALVFVGAAGIAVRSIAPYVKHKTVDPAVIVMDDAGHFVIPILSGHLGGANELARELAQLTDAVPVITTATDVNGVFSVDEWAKFNGMHVKTPGRIKFVSSKVIAGEAITINCRFPVDGEIPKFVSITSQTDCDVYVDYDVKECLGKPEHKTLILIPKILCLGIGCRKGTPVEKIVEAFEIFTKQNQIDRSALYTAASIDVKKDEQGIIDFCKKENIPYITYSADELNQVPGEFTASAFVKKTVGVDNVCERSAIKAAGEDAKLVIKKFAYDGVTFAIAEKAYAPCWKWGSL